MPVPVSVVQSLRAVAGLGGLAIGSGAVLGSLVAIGALRAQRAVRINEEIEAPRASGLFGEKADGEPIRLAMIGDSLALGVGADKPAQTVGAMLATGLTTLAARPVMLYNVAESGSESKDLPTQLARLQKLSPSAPDVAVIIVGGNDVMQRQKVTLSVRHLYRAVLQLRRRGTRVVVGTCPDMGTVPTLIQPLRYWARQQSRLLASAQAMVVIRAGGRSIPLGDTLGPIFWHNPKMMYSADLFHPSSLGYARAAALMLPSVWASADRRSASDTASSPSPSGHSVEEATADAIASSL